MVRIKATEMVWELRLVPDFSEACVYSALIYV
jgi:hypothetical protein